MIRGACPSLHAPLPSGDGLLVRMTIRSTLSLEAFAALCDAARRHGNGVMEITARGNLQIRGLTPGSAEAFAAAIMALGIAPPSPVPIAISPLAGLQGDGTIDVAPLADQIAEAARPLALSPKVSIVLDGGGDLHLDAVSADVRLLWRKARWHVALSGDAARAAGLGTIAPDAVCDTVMRLLTVIAARGPDARARTVIATEGLAPFRHAVRDLLFTASAPPPRAAGDPIGLHVLRAGKVAQGLGLPFGHGLSTALMALTTAAQRAGASGLRLAPDRALLVLLDGPDEAAAMRQAAAALGLIVHADDPRRAIVACPGAPACASGEMAARDLAGTIAAVAAPLLKGSVRVHLSGCPKGCAHPLPAAVTVVGRAGACGLVFDGTAREPPAAVLTAEALTAWLADLATET
ncbi:MAG TPA: precorrin-3B synthase, partial [Xanthobacteraceae bacterium]|nr:precorrin-3B synthase [Xanthobacteraceae bacterium]